MLKPTSFARWLAALLLSTIPSLAQPQISIAPTGEGQVQLSWPETSEEFLIKRSHRLLDPPVWGDVTENVIVTDNVNYVVISVSQLTEFFELRDNSPDQVTALGLQSGEVPLGLASPPNPENRTLSITVTQIPTNGEVRRPNNELVAPGAILTLEELLGLTFTSGDVNAVSELQFTIDYGDGIISTVRISLQVVSSSSGVLLWASTPQTGNALFYSDGETITLAGNVPEAGVVSGNLLMTPIGFVNGVFYFVSGGQIVSFDGTDYSLLDARGPNGDGISVGNRYYYLTYSSGTEGEGHELAWTDFVNPGGYLDINPGRGSSSPENFVDIDGVFHFTADDGNGRVWWKMVGDVPVKAVLPENEGVAPDGSSPVHYHQVYTYYGPGDYENALWGYDGIKNGPVADTFPGGNDNVNQIIPFGNGAIFPANDGSETINFYIYYENGSPTLIPIGGPTIQFSASLIWQNTFYFYDVSGTQKLWMFDGSSSAVEVPNQPFAAIQSLDPIKQFDDFLTISGLGYIYWVFDGVNFTQPLVPEALGGGSYHRILNPDTFLNGVYYVNLGGVNMTWDGSETVTILTDSFGNTGNSLVYPLLLDSGGNAIVAATSTSSTDNLEPYSYDGVDTTKLTGNNVGYLVRPFMSRVFQGALYFSGRVTGIDSKLWTFDGTDVAPASALDSGPTLSASYPEIIEYKSKLYFYGVDDANVPSTWSFDGTTYEEMAFTGRQFTVLGDLLMFTAPDSVTGSRGELWSWDGVNDPILRPVHPTPNQTRYSNPQELTVVGSSLFFTANDSPNSFDFELWEFNGSDAPVKHNVNPSGLGGVSDITEFNGKVYFGASTGQYASSNRQLFSYDAVNGVSWIGSWTNFRPTALLVYGDKIYFQGYDNGVTRRTFFHDGDPTHTVSKFVDDPVYLYKIGENLVMAYLSNTWSFDGTTITLLSDILGPTGSGTVLGDNLYFTAAGFLEDGSHVGSELWVTDGATAPSLVADLNDQPAPPVIKKVIENPFNQ